MNEIISNIKDKIKVTIPLDSKVYNSLNRIAIENNKLLEDILAYYIENELIKLFELKSSNVDSSIKDYIIITYKNEKYKILQYVTNKIEVINLNKAIKVKPTKTILKKFNDLLDDDDKLNDWTKYNTQRTGKILIDKFKSIKYNNIKLNNDENWIDQNSKLMWEVKLDNKVYNWFETKKYAEELNNNNYCSFNDWRIPTKEELETLIGNKDINLHENMYWSSTSYSDNNAYFLSVFHQKISFYNKRYAYYIRCVRNI